MVINYEYKHSILNRNFTCHNMYFFNRQKQYQSIHRKILNSSFIGNWKHFETKHRPAMLNRKTDSFYDVT